jgi:LysR family transcriptional activator of dmlA
VRACVDLLAQEFSEWDKGDKDEKTVAPVKGVRR